MTSSETLSILYGENVFQLSFCSSEWVKALSTALRPASLDALRHIEISIECRRANSYNSHDFITALTSQFILSTLAIPVVRERPNRTNGQYAVVNTLLFPSYDIIPTIYESLHSGRVEKIRWGWSKVP